MSEYQKRKEKARQQAIIWAEESCRKSLPYGEILDAAARFRKEARRYGLLREFSENGII